MSGGLTTAGGPVFTFRNFDLGRREEIHLVEGVLLAHRHGFLL